MSIVDKMRAFRTVVSRINHDEPQVPELSEGLAPEGRERQRTGESVGA